MASQSDPTTSAANEPAAQRPSAAELRRQIDDLLVTNGAARQKPLVRRLIETGVRLGQDNTSRLNLKISAAAVAEMRTAFNLFEPYAGVPKVTIFGSARTQEHDPLWLQAHDVAELLAETGWMVVTGAGPGIMEAATVGAGLERSLGVSIRLPFEEPLDDPDDALAARRVTMKYFFTRKLMLVKESQGFVCLPGGFGTMDEVFELLTLQQTGKMAPVPIVLLDREGGSYWQHFAGFITEQLAGSGYTSVDDLDRVIVTDSPQAAAAEIIGFWRNYHSLRWVGGKLVLRLHAAPTAAEIADLNDRFSGLLEAGVIEATGPLPEEVADGDELEFSRIVFTPRPRAVGDLHRLIRAVNELASAPEL